MGLKRKFLNERFITNVLKIGVRIGAEVPVPFGENDKFEVKVKSEHIKRALKRSMDDGEEGMMRRKLAREFGEMAKKAMEKGGSSHFNMTAMIEAVTKELANNSKSCHNIV
ncbi:hypothetical protein R6Q59_024663 [Mikania micrantha]